MLVEGDQLEPLESTPTLWPHIFAPRPHPSLPSREVVTYNPASRCVQMDSRRRHCACSTERSWRSAKGRQAAIKSYCRRGGGRRADPGRCSLHWRAAAALRPAESSEGTAALSNAASALLNERTPASLKNAAARSCCCGVRLQRHPPRHRPACHPGEARRGALSGCAGRHRACREEGRRRRGPEDTARAGRRTAEAAGGDVTGDASDGDGDGDGDGEAPGRRQRRATATTATAAKGRRCGAAVYAFAVEESRRSCRGRCCRRACGSRAAMALGQQASSVFYRGGLLRRGGDLEAERSSTREPWRRASGRTPHSDRATRLRRCSRGRRPAALEGLQGAVAALHAAHAASGVRSAALLVDDKDGPARADAADQSAAAFTNDARQPLPSDPLVGWPRARTSQRSLLAQTPLIRIQSSRVSRLLRRRRAGAPRRRGGGGRRPLVATHLARTASGCQRRSGRFPRRRPSSPASAPWAAWRTGAKGLDGGVDPWRRRALETALRPTNHRLRRTCRCAWPPARASVRPTRCAWRRGGCSCSTTRSSTRCGTWPRTSASCCSSTVAPTVDGRRARGRAAALPLDEASWWTLHRRGRGSSGEVRSV